MDEKKIAFIICVNDLWYYEECVRYIQELCVPDTYTVDIMCIQEADSMAEGYNGGCEASDAKYKVYLHQDTFITNRNYIYDILDMTVEEAVPFFENVPSIRNKIETLNDVGLSYIKLGQPSTTLSGGEAQRIKLATELSRRSTGNTIYILDEPTTGLHFADVHKLVEILQRLTDNGNTVVVIEHNLDVIKTADYIIDMGPDGGDRGGTVVTCGTPEEVAEHPTSYTGKYVKKMLERYKENVEKYRNN